MELIYEFDRQKLFITVNMRSFVSDAEAELFARTVIAHGYRVLMLESAEKEKAVKRKQADNRRRSVRNRLICPRF